MRFSATVPSHPVAQCLPRVWAHGIRERVVLSCQVPHGLGVDLNGFLYISEDWDDPDADIRKLRCDGTLLPESEFVLEAQAFNISSVGNTIVYNQVGAGRARDVITHDLEISKFQFEYSMFYSCFSNSFAG